MDDHNRVRTLVRNIQDEPVTEIVMQTFAVPSLGGDGIYEDQAGI
jgi:hypothetical protein